MNKTIIAFVAIIVSSTAYASNYKKNYVTNTYVSELYDDTTINKGLDASVAIGGLELTNPNKNNLSWSMGIGGVNNATFAAGMAYGLTDKVFGYTKMNLGTHGVHGYFFGVSGKF